MDSEMYLKKIIPILLIICNLAVTMTEGYQIGVGRADCTGPAVEIGFVSSELFFISIYVGAF